MCLRCLFGAPLELGYSPSSGYRLWIPGLPAAGAGPSVDAAFEALIEDLVLWTDWFDEQYPHSYCADPPPVSPRLLWTVLRPHLRRQIGEPVAPCQDGPPARDFN
jgi:hypothetical protein